MYTNRSILYIVLILLLSKSVNAYEPERAINNFAHELAVCSAYFNLTSDILLIEADEDQVKLSNQYKFFAADFLTVSIKISNEAVFSSRFKLATRKMISELNSDTSNFSILLEKYHTHCLQIKNNPNERFDYWLNK